MLRNCVNCGKRFREWRTPDERLLDAIFGAGPLCKSCAKKRDEELSYLCRSCWKPIPRGKEIFFNNQPYHSYCLPYSD